MAKRLVSKNLLPLLLITAVTTACSTAPTTTPTPTTNSPTTTPVSTTTQTDVVVAYDTDDTYTDWQSENPVTIELKSTTATINGTGAAMKGKKLMILSPGTYVLSGELTDGQIYVDSQTKGTVRIVLNGATIKSSDSAAIYIKEADKAILTLAQGTTNSITDGATYTADAGEQDPPNAAIYSADGLTINGAGALTVQANYNNGIMGKDDLKVTGGQITIKAVDDGLIGRDTLLVQNGTFTIEAGGDAIRSTNETDPAKGYIALSGGTFTLTAGGDGIQAATALQIDGGTYQITTNGGSANGGGTEKSAKGIKATTSIAINGGTLTVDSADDALHANGTLAIAGGDLTLTSGDDGVHADTAITISGGKTTVTKSYEGIESTLITISGGETRVTASDDGINIGGGADGSSMGGRPGQNTLTSTGTNALHINGGYVFVDSTGDGLDANGSIYMTDVTVIVNGPTANNNGALDYDGTFELTGGTLVAAGSAGMGQAPATTSTQYSVAMTFAQAQQAGQLVSLLDSKGNALLTFAPKRPYQLVVISTPALQKDGSYTLATGGNSSGTVTDGLYAGGALQSSAKVVSFPLATSPTWLNESGVTTGGGGFGGGMPPRR